MRRSVRLSAYLGSGSLYMILIPLLAAGAWGVFVFSGAIRDSIAAGNELNARTVDGRLDGFLEQTRQALDRIADITQRGGLYPQANMDAYLRDSLEDYPFLESIEVIGADDRVRWTVPADPQAIGSLRAGESVYESVKAAAADYWSGSYISLKHNAAAVTFGRRAGAYVVLCGLNLGSIERYSLPADGSSPAGFQISVTDENGIYLSEPDGAKIRRREQFPGFAAIRAAAGVRAAADVRASFELKLEGAAYLVSTARVADPAWYVVVRYPVARIDRILRDYYAGFFSILFGAALVGLAISRLGVRRIESSLDRIERRAALAAAGDYGGLAEFGDGFQEFERVGVAFNGMLEGIKAREAVLLNRERGLRQILEDIRLFALGVDAQNRVSFANPYLLEATGYAPAELAGADAATILPPPADGAPSPFQRIARGENPGPTHELPLSGKGGGIRLVEWTITPVRDSEGRLAGATGIGTDITAARAQRRRLERSLAEKETLLKEVHHRVKNNLQLISSLLRIQGDEADGAPNPQLERAQRRIASIALIHEMLYASSDFGCIDFSAYLSTLAREILEARPEGAIALALPTEPCYLALDDAVPCGLIMNETLTNIRKYAFPPDWRGRPRVELDIAAGADGTTAISVRDNGVGLPPGYSVADSPSMGHTIVRLLAQQLEARLDLRSDGGVYLELAFRPRSVVPAS
jgi:PAS domain S-box-containing protein